MRFRLIAAAVAFACIGVTPLVAQQSAEQKDVLAALDKFFDGMTRKDTTVSRAVLLPGSVFYATFQGSVQVTPDTRYLGSLTTGKGKWEEKIHDPSVMVHGDVAEVWTPYEFFIDGTRSHCGIDSFTFVKTADGWRMATAVYTVERSGCPDVSRKAN